MSEWTVFVVDDDEGVRSGLSFLLRTAGYAVRTFSSAIGFLDTFDVEQRGCLLLDIRMPHMTGLELQQELNQRRWRVPTIFITGHATVPSAIAALRAGAFDFIEKPLRDDALIETVARARRQEEIAHEENLQRAETEAHAALLTPREREVLDLVAAGEQNKAIARRLGISFRTVEIHRSHILEKMQARTISHLIRMAIMLESSRSADKR